ncbi:MAG: ROK family transcriptional regulator [Eubacteriales bacterium]|nr:ROK family transcriptional regulator [Eubacteriales bacterium]
MYSTSSTTKIKSINKKKVYMLLKKGNAYTKRDIALATNISLPTVTQNLLELQDAGLVLQIGSTPSTGGRKAENFQLSTNVFYSIGLDITRNHVAILIMNLSERITYHKRFSLKFTKEDQYFSNLADLISKILSENKIDESKILGVGISVPVIVMQNQLGLSCSTILGTSGISLENFTRFIPFPCVLCNDAKVAASAELRTNSLYRDILYLSLSNTVGGAIIHNRSICVGLHERSGEFGHMRIYPNGRPCYCGQLGCFDAYCNATILSRYENNSLENFFKELEKGNLEYQELFHEYLDNLAIGLNNLHMIFDYPIILGGYVGSFIKPYIPSIKKRLEKLNTFEKNASYIHACNLQLEASAVGAAYLFLDRFESQL